MNRAAAETHLTLMTSDATALKLALYYLCHGHISADICIEAAEDVRGSRAESATDEQKTEAVRILTLLAKIA